MANETQDQLGQIFGISNMTNESRLLKCEENSVLQVSSISHGDIPMILVDTTRETPIGSILIANETYISPVIDRPEQDIPDGYMRIWVLADQSGNLYLEESHNGTNWTTTSSAVVSAGVSNILAWTKLSRRYSRCRYVNGATPQTSFIMIHYTKGVNIEPVMIADGDVATLGVKADTANIDPTASSSVNANLKGILKYTIGSVINIGNVLSITTAGTRVQLPNIACREVTIIAKRTNTGYIYVGGSDVSPTVYGIELATKDRFTYKVVNANQIYIDASVSGEGISYIVI